MKPNAKRLAAAFALVLAAGCVRDDASAGAADSSPHPAKPKAIGIWNIQNAAGARAERPVHLEFLANGTVNGYAGCNTINATYAMGPGDAIKFGPVRQTKMFCPGAPMETEKRVIAALSRAARIEAKGARLTLRDAGGSVLLRFERPAPR